MIVVATFATVMVLAMIAVGVIVAIEDMGDI